MRILKGSTPNVGPTKLSEFQEVSERRQLKAAIGELEEQVGELQEIIDSTPPPTPPS